MIENETNNTPETETTPDNEKTAEKAFALNDSALGPVSSAAPLAGEEKSEAEEIALRSVISESAQADLTETAPPPPPEKEADPIFAELAAPKLPELQRENRAWLQMQSPNRLYFYWSIKNNPFQTLQKVFGGQQNSYQLVAKLVNQTHDREEFHPVDAAGNWWFNVEANSNYRAEIGFYAPNRPYIRVMFSNEIETPRKSPSPRIATEADWAISSRDFAEVLDNSGFSRDAFEVALAGDDRAASEAATGSAFSQLVGERDENIDFDAEEVRFAILALASGVSLDELRGQISEALYLFLQEHAARLSVENALAALKEHFDVFDEEIYEEEEIGALVFGASLVNFPKTVRKRGTTKTVSPKTKDEAGPKLLRGLSPLSSSNWRN